MRSDHTPWDNLPPAETVRRLAAADRMLSAAVEHGPREIAEFAAEVLAVIEERRVMVPPREASE